MDEDIHSQDKLKERIKELNCLYRLSKLTDEHELSREEFLQSAVELIPGSWKYPKITCARLSIDNTEYRTRGFKETPWRQTAAIYVDKEKQGFVEVFYLKEMPQLDEGPFSKEERNLLDTFAKNLGNNLERLQKEERYRAVFENTGSATVILEKDGTISLANQRFAELAGYAIEEIENKMKWIEFAVEEDLSWMWEQHSLRRQSTDNALKEYEFRFVDKNKKIKDIHLIIDTIIGTDKSVASLIDVTARKSAERELRKLYDNFFHIFNSSPAALALTSVKDGKFLTINEAYIEIMGYEREEIIGNTVKDLSIYVNEGERKTLVQKLKDNGRVRNFELLVRTKSGNQRYLLVSMEQVSYEKEEAIISTFIDITDRKLAEKNLQDSEQKFRDIFNHISDAVIIINMQGSIIEVNDIACDRLGYSREEMLKMSPMDIDTPEYAKYAKDKIQKIEQEGELTFESVHRRKDGYEFSVEVNARLTEYEGETAIISMVRDISERRKMEKVKQLLYKLSQLSMTAQSLQEYIKSLHEELGQIMKAENFYIALYDENTDTYTLPYHVDEYEDFSSGKNISLKNSLTDYIRKKGEARLITGEIEEKLKDQNEIHLIGTPSPVWIGAPIVDSSSNKVTGVIALQDYHDADAYDEEDVNILNIVATNIGIFIERIRNLEQLKLLSRSIEQNPVIIIITDPKGTIEYVNPAFTQITGYTLNEAKGENPRILQSGYHTGEFYKNLWETILSGKNWEGELHNKKKSGELYVEQAIISPILDESGQIAHFVGVKEDITEKKNMVEDLKQAKEKAEESDRLKSAFLANMSHEIRTPMNGILGFTDLLQEPELTTDEKDQYINMIQKSGKRMLNTVNDIVEISKIEAGIISLEPDNINVNTCIKDLAQFFEPEAEKKGLELKIDPLLPEHASELYIDQNKFESVLSNLIKNAIKYTNQGSVHVGCFLRETHVEFYVQDNGIGIPKERQAAIFKRFEQADISDTRAFEGSGLGLAISKAYVEMFNGDIWLESEVNQGSIFHFTVPLGKKAAKETDADLDTSEEKEKSKKGMNNSNNKLKILIAEDDEDSYAYLTAILKKWEGLFLRAVTGTEAVEKYNQNPDIDLILMDIKLPGGDGYEATRKIREHDSKVPIIAQTAYAMSGDRKKALDAGCNDYIAKPIKKNELIEKINNLTKG
ncbi:MAG: PAS domain S-box protein [Bacteroidales bacterium]|nr:PAS domain S-box protein [Bacteroidales bacterium]MCF8334245.1 PAS domain S-box protein [Bacteroidales bacterium]